MLTVIYLAVLLWAGIGLYMLREAIEQGNKKALKAPIAIIGKAIIYGPYTRSKLIPKL